MSNYESNWSELLRTAISEPGLILRAYSAFYNYSLGNQLAAMIQCTMKGILPSPLNTYAGWQALNRQVKKGQKALFLCMPLTSKRRNEQGEDEMFISSFVWKPKWFTLSQTDGEPVEMPKIPSWNKDLALKNLQITQIEFDMLNGNVQGYARKRSIAVSPLAQLPHKTLFHEMAHIVLSHTTESDFHDGD